MDYPSAAREALADFSMPVLPEHFVFCQNATDSLNLLIHGFARKTRIPFHTITTELEHNSVLRPLTALEKDGITRLTIVPFTDNRVESCRDKKGNLRRYAARCHDAREQCARVRSGYQADRGIPPCQ